MKFKPLGDHLVVEAMVQPDHTIMGIFVPETAREKPQEGKVVAAGPGARRENGERITMDVKVGDTVLYARYAGAQIKIQGKAYLICQEHDVLAIVL